MMEPRLSLVTLGVSDIARSKAFYEAFGLQNCVRERQDRLPANGRHGAGAVWQKKDLDGDMARENAGHGHIALAHNTRTEAEVDAIIDHAVASGGSLLKAAHKAGWGGYSGYFADPDGHAWEVAYNPYWTIDAEGRINMGL